MIRPLSTSLALVVTAVIGCASNPPPPAASTPAAAGPMMTGPSANTTPAASPPAAGAPKVRKPEEILADSVNATGGAAAWNAHKTAHYKLETTLQGMGMGAAGERFQTQSAKSFTVMDMPGLGRVREGTNGKVAWSDDPAHGIRYLDGAEAEQTRIGSSWNVEMHAAELFAKLESAAEPGPDGTTLECVIATPRVGAPMRSCYDPRSHLQVSQSGVHASPEGDMPFRATVRDWRTVGGVKMPFESDSQIGPISTVDRILAVTFDEPVDDKMFDPPKPGDKKPGDKK